MSLSFFDRIRDFRNRKVSDPAFRRWAARFAMTRPFARKQAKALFDLSAGFVYSQVLSACVRIELFDRLAAGPLNLTDIAAACGLSLDSTERLLKAAAALGLVQARRGRTYALGPLGAALVGNPGVKAMILHNDVLYGDLRDPIGLLEGRTDPQLMRYWTYADKDSISHAAAAGSHANYTQLMAASQDFVTAEILDAYSIGRHKALLDIGGGDGTFLLAVAKAAPSITLSLFDLPEVAALARQRLMAAGLAGRAKVYGGSFFKDDLPRGADLVTLIRVLHDHDDAAALAILRAARQAVAPTGTLLLAEPMSGTRGAEASGDAYFGFYLLAMGQGRPRPAEEIGRLLDEAGFGSIRPISTNTPLIARILIARPS